MILRAFREKSLQNYINKLINSNQKSVTQKKVDSIGVLLHFKEFSDFELIRAFLKSLNFRDEQLKVVAYTEKRLGETNLWNTHFCAKDLSWGGKINNIELETFVNTEFDMLISYYKDDITQLNAITAMSKANFKVGLSGIDNRLYDLIIDVLPQDFKLFGIELVKYLTVLNKL